MASDSRFDAVDAYLKAVRTSERSAVEWVERSITDDVELVIEPAPLFDPQLAKQQGRAALIEHIGRVWPFTPTYAIAGFGDPEPGMDGGLVVQAVFPPMGAAPRRMSIAFEFDGDGRIRRVVETTEANMSLSEPTKEMPLEVRAAINGALAAGTPMVFAYTNAEGDPSVSLRGSIQVYSGTQLCMWMRPRSRFATVLERNPNLALLYRDSRTRSTLSISGTGEMAEGEVRDRIYNLIPEVEQTHDTERQGDGLIINLKEIRGSLPSGPVYVKP